MKHSKQRDKKTEEILAEKINAYNTAHSDKPIQFIHGSSSAIFAYMGREVRDDKGETKTIPKAIIPTGQLRKRYGVYPISGELGFGVFGFGGRRKAAVNYNNISGMSPDTHGIETCLSYASIKRNVEINEIHECIEILIKNMNGNNYISHLKMLVLHVTNLMLMNPDATKKADYYLKLLDSEYDVLKKQGGHDKRFAERFKKYYDDLAARLRGEKYAFKSDQKFIEDIINQFPIILCSTVTPEGFSRGVYQEKIYTGDVDLTTVNIIFTSKENVQALQMRLQQLGMKHIEVIGLEPKPQKRKKFEKNTSRDTHLKRFLSAKNISQLTDAIEKLNNPDKQNEYLAKVVSACADAYIKEGDVNKFMMMEWILKNIKSDLFDIIFEDSLNKYMFLAVKVRAVPDYLSRLEDESAIIYPRLKKMVYLYALEMCTQRTSGATMNQEFFDYTRKIDIHKLTIDINKFKNEIGKFYDSEYSGHHKLTRIASLLIVLLHDQSTQSKTKIKANIQAKIDLVTPLVLKEVDEFLKNRTSDSAKELLDQLELTINSKEVIQKIREMVKDHNKKRAEEDEKRAEEDKLGVNNLKEEIVHKIRKEIKRLKKTRTNLFLTSPKEKIKSFELLIDTINSCETKTELFKKLQAWYKINIYTIGVNRTNLSLFKSKDTSKSQLFVEKLIADYKTKLQIALPPKTLPKNR